MAKSRPKVKDGKIVQSENSVHFQVGQYLKLQYPSVLFHTDSSGELWTEAQRFRMAKINKGNGWPDLMIAHPVGSRHGLFLELKKNREAMFKADGVTFKTSLIVTQHKILMHLRGLNYAAYFACGFDEAKQLIDNYLSGN